MKLATECGYDFCHEKFVFESDSPVEILKDEVAKFHIDFYRHKKKCYNIYMGLNDAGRHYYAKAC